MWSNLKTSLSFWFGISFVFAAALTLPFAAVEKATHEKLLAEGEPTEAAVIDRGQRSEDEDRSHWLQLQYYDLNLKEFKHQHTVPKALWDRYPIGSMIRVRYLKEDPQKVTPEAMMDKPEWKTVLAMGLTFGVIGVAIAGLAMVKARRVAQQ